MTEQVKVFYGGPASAIHPGTGVLLHPGWNHLDPDPAAALVTTNAVTLEEPGAALPSAVIPGPAPRDRPEDEEPKREGERKGRTPRGASPVAREGRE